MSISVVTEGLSKIYRRSDLRFRRRSPEAVPAVSDVTFSVAQGELFGLLGPNGAGKTTLVKMLCTLIIPTAGSAQVAGIDLRDDRAIRAVTGLVVSDERSFYWRLSSQKNLSFFAALQGLHGRAAADRVAGALEDVGLTERAGQRFSDLSSGMRQRLAIARSLLHEPQVLFLDEPTRSLDPVATLQVHELLQRLRYDKQITIVLITHDLAEAEKMCRRIALMHNGRIQAIGEPKELRRRLDPRQHYTLTIDAPGDNFGSLFTECVTGCQLSSLVDDVSKVQLSFTAGQQDGRLPAVLELLRQHQLQIYAIDAAPPTLEEVFAHYTGDEGDNVE